MAKNVDVIVIGGGVVGTAVLDRLARFNVSSLLLEKSDDVAAFSTRANSGIVHAGYDCDPGTLKAKYNVRGNALLWQDAEALGVKHLQCGSIVVAKAGQEAQIEKLRQKALANGSAKTGAACILSPAPTSKSTTATTSRSLESSAPSPASKKCSSGQASDSTIFWQTRTGPSCGNFASIMSADSCAWHLNISRTMCSPKWANPR